MYTQFQQEPSAPVVQAIQRELEAIMAPTGLQFSWHALAEAGGQITSQLAVIHFKGECDADGLRAESGFPGPLGWTQVSEGEILPFIDVNCDGLRILAHLAVRLEGMRIPARLREHLVAQSTEGE